MNRLYIIGVGTKAISVLGVATYEEADKKKTDTSIICKNSELKEILNGLKSENEGLKTVWL